MSRNILNRRLNQKKNKQSQKQKQKKSLADVNTSEDDDNESRSKFHKMNYVIKECQDSDEQQKESKKGQKENCQQNSQKKYNWREIFEKKSSQDSQTKIKEKQNPQKQQEIKSIRKEQKNTNSLRNNLFNRQPLKKEETQLSSNSQRLTNPNPFIRSGIQTRQNYINPYNPIACSDDEQQQDNQSSGLYTFIDTSSNSQYFRPTSSSGGQIFSNIPPDSISSNNNRNIFSHNISSTTQRRSLFNFNNTNNLFRQTSTNLVGFFENVSENQTQQNEDDFISQRSSIEQVSKINIQVQNNDSESSECNCPACDSYRRQYLERKRQKNKQDVSQSSKKSQQSNKFVDLDCPICMSNIQNNARLSCRHNFCKDCLQKWLQKTSKCPLCRVDGKYYVTEGEKHKIQSKEYGLQNFYDNLPFADDDSQSQFDIFEMIEFTFVTGVPATTYMCEECTSAGSIRQNCLDCRDRQINRRYSLLRNQRNLFLLQIAGLPRLRHLMQRLFQFPL